MRREAWTEERLHFDRDSYFEDLLGSLGQANRSIELETYIFEPDVLGIRVMETLKEAAQRGVRVRLLIDGVGSLFWIGIIRDQLKGSRVELRVHHPVSLFRSALGKLNRRLHRKVCIIDRKSVFLGSFNITQRNFRDTGVRLEGAGVRELGRAFDTLWEGRPPRSPGWRGFRRIPVRLNLTRKMRQARNQDLVRRIRGAGKRIWITNAYFVPPLFLLRALCQAGSRGVDVRLLLPAEPDYRFMKWLSEAYYRTLLSSGVRIFEYRARFLHAKSMLIDEGFASVGSTNLNHRSLIHDLEVDVELLKPESLSKLSERFENDLRDSVEVGFRDWEHEGLFARLLRMVLSRFRYWA